MNLSLICVRLGSLDACIWRHNCGVLKYQTVAVLTVGGEIDRSTIASVIEVDGSSDRSAGRLGALILFAGADLGLFGPR